MPYRSWHRYVDRRHKERGIPTIEFCLCGCGQHLPDRPIGTKGHFRLYINEEHRNAYKRGIVWSDGPRFCECGCGEVLPEGSANQRRFVSDQHAKLVIYRARQRKREDVYCACGCGTLIPAKALDDYGPQRRFVNSAHGKRVAKDGWSPERLVREKETARRAGRRLKRKRMAHIRSFKTHCQRCGHNFPPEDLDFHHRDPKMKKYTVGAMAGRSIRLINEEIAKCDVLCKVCHRNLHELERLKAKDPDVLDLTVEYRVKKRSAILPLCKA